MFELCQAFRSGRFRVLKQVMQVNPLSLLMAISCMRLHAPRVNNASLPDHGYDSLEHEHDIDQQLVSRLRPPDTAHRSGTISLGPVEYSHMHLLV